MGNINIKFIFLSGGFSATRRSWRATSSSSTAQSRPQTQTSTSSGSQSRLKKREGKTIPTVQEQHFAFQEPSTEDGGNYIVKARNAVGEKDCTLALNFGSFLNNIFLKSGYEALFSNNFSRRPAGRRGEHPCQGLREAGAEATRSGHSHTGMIHNFDLRLTLASQKKVFFT